MEIALIALIFLFLYVTVFTIYYFLISFSSRNRKHFVRTGKYNKTNYYNNLVVIVYSHNNEKTVVPLLESLNKQKYPKENYKIYLILDNCTDNSSNLVEMVGGANIFRVGESYTVGKDESISQLLDRLIAFQNIDAYVFLGADRSIDDDFLNYINQGLVKHDVLVGNTVLKGEPKNLKDKIVGAYNTYENNILNTSRSMLGLSTLINSDCCVIKHSVIEKVQCIDFKSIDSELKYSVMLAKLNYKTSFDPNIVTYLERENFEIRKPSFSYRISLLKNSLQILLKSGFLFNEFVLSAIQPGVLALFLFLSFLFWVVVLFDIENPGFYLKILNQFNILIISAILLSSYVYSLTNSKLTIKEMLYLCLYPIYSLGQLLRKFPIIKQVFDYIDNIKNPKQIESHKIPVVVAAGEKKMNCEIELIEEDGMIRGIFSFKNKKQATDLHLRIFDAIKNISNMLSEKEYEIVDPDTKKIVEKGNFDLQICQNCKFFTTKIDGTINVIKGTCSCQNSTVDGLEKLVMLWQSCENYAPAKEKIVDMTNYRTK